MTRAIVMGLILLAAPVAQGQSCPPDQDVAPWVSFDAGDQGPGSTWAPAGGSLTICSSTDGFGESTDKYRYAFQLRDHDFVIQALVTEVDPGGSGGLVAVVPSVSSARSARITAEVFVGPGGAAVLRSSIRRASDGPTDAAIAEIPVTLPAALEVVREGNEIRTGIAGGAIHLTATVDPQGELMGPMRVGVAQASNGGFLRSATFTRLHLSTPEPGASAECVETEAAMGGAPFRIAGRHLDRVDGVRIGGVDAPILTASGSRLLVEAPTPRASFLHAPVEISQDGRFQRVGMATSVGTPIRRGDVDEDGDVGTEDYRRLCYHVYRGAALECSEAGDVDADGDIDRDDVDRLRRHLRTGRHAPEAPFETAGLVKGSLACGMPEGPEIHAIELADGRPIDRRVREGDELAIVGVGLPSAERAVVRFGNNEAVVTRASTARRLVVRIGRVFGDGEQCPRIFDADPAPQGETRFGPAFGLDDSSDLCVPFEGSALAGHLQGRMVGQRLEIHVPPSSLRPGNRLRIALSVHLPYVVGQSRGPRAANFDFFVPNVPYGEALGLLAARVTEAVQGSSSNDCGCEVAATDVVREEKLLLQPCVLLPDPPPEPPFPGLPTQVEATKIVWTAMDIFSDIPGPGCTVEFDRHAEPRRFFWCQLEDLARVQGVEAGPFLAGLPLWESYDPPIDHASPDPLMRSTEDKQILVDETMMAFLDMFYRSPCEMALRATQCGDPFFASWLPKFAEGARVIKTFWQPLEGLPSSVDETTLYSYDPWGSEPRKYLVGMHVGYSIGAIGDGPAPDYFEWSTFWLPADGDTTTKGGAALSTVYSPHCTVGFGGDRPGSFAGTPFAAFEMCTDSKSGEEACGNPWEPSECPQNGPTSCTGCHEAVGTVHWGNHGTSFDPEPLRAGWLSTIVAASGPAAAACLAEIETNPGAFDPEWIKTPPAVDADNCSVGF